MKSLKPGALAAAAIFSIYYFYGLTAFAAFILSVAVHELGHIAVILLLGGKIKNIRSLTGGLSIDSAGTISEVSEVCALLAGPAAGLLMWLICIKLNLNSFTAITSRLSLSLSAFNIMPALPLDGGRAAELLLFKNMGRAKTEKILSVSSIISGVLLMLYGALKAQIILVGAGLWLLIAQTGIVKKSLML